MTSRAEQELREAQQRAELLPDIQREREDRDAAHAAANERLVEAIEAAREVGATWDAVAEAMGMTRTGLRMWLDRHDYQGR